MPKVCGVQQIIGEFLVKNPAKNIAKSEQGGSEGSRLLLVQRTVRGWRVVLHGSLALAGSTAVVVYHLIVSTALEVLPTVTPSSTQNNGTQSDFRNHLASPTFLPGMADRCRMCRGECHLSCHPVVPSLSCLFRL